MLKTDNIDKKILLISMEERIERFESIKNIPSTTDGNIRACCIQTLDNWKIKYSGKLDIPRVDLDIPTNDLLEVYKDAYEKVKEYENIKRKFLGLLGYGLFMIDEIYNKSSRHEPD